ncbi:MAG: phosphatidate cytidylyltransferase [Duodenibacillus sp.]|nr:phosphatidate cytidylyltransferase [Duodenibacillus sp.]
MRLGITLQQGYIILFTALVLLIGAATVYGLWAAGRQVGAARRRRIDIANSRVRIGWWMIAAFCSAWWGGLPAITVLFALCSFFLLREFLSLTPIKHTDYWVLVLAFYVTIPVQYLLVYFGQQALFTLLIPVYLTLGLPVVSALSRDTDRFLERIAKVQFGVMLCVFCVSHAPAIATLDFTRYNSSGPLMLLYYMTVIFCADLFTVLASSAFGGPALRMAPNKTLWGFLLGGGSAFLVGLALYWLTPFRLWQAALYSFLIVVAGAMGDFVIQSIKMSLGSRSYEGDLYIGRGTLERYAPLIFSAPVFYHTTLIFFKLVDFDQIIDQSRTFLGQ